MFVAPYPAAPPVQQLLLRLRERPGLCCFDGDGTAPRGRYSFLGSNPTAVVERAPGEGQPLSALDALQPPAPDEAGAARAGDNRPTPPSPGQVPCWAGYIAYDALFDTGFLPARAEPTGRDADAVPVLHFGRYDAWVAWDHVGGGAFLVGDDRDACERLAERLAAPAPAVAPIRPVDLGPVRATPSEQHLAAIGEALQHIGDGDIYQVNLARRFEAAYDGDPLRLALAMRAQGPVPLGMLLQEGGRTVISRSMELFLRWDRAGQRVTTGPIKGTTPRAGGRDTQEAEALRADPKERAEHAMIVDLMRNDLGRVATTGSVRVAELLAVEPYAGLSHLVSRVECGVPATLTASALLGATFPPGSVTGTPKRRAVQLIAALEDNPRGIYTGAVGFFDRAGGCNLAVAIRTAVVADGRASYHAGGGIVEASEPTRELAETELKARCFTDALTTLRA